MHVTIVGELANVTVVDLQFLPACSISGPSVCTAGSGCLGTAWPEGVEEPVLALGGV